LKLLKGKRTKPLTGVKRFRRQDYCNILLYLGCNRLNVVDLIIACSVFLLVLVSTWSLFVEKGIKQGTLMAFIGCWRLIGLL